MKYYKEGDTIRVLKHYTNKVVSATITVVRLQGYSVEDEEGDSYFIYNNEVIDDE